jgi:drug/metabolite transporter (DMT)-like permease
MATLFVTVLGISICADSIAQICFRRGMEQVGPLEGLALPGLLNFLWRTLHNSYIVVGTTLAAVGFFLYLGALSLKALTVVYPLVAVQYGIVTLLAILVLKEQVSPERWAGIALVALGVMLIGRSGN